MPKRKKVFVNDYDLKKSFTTASGKAYASGNLILWSRYSDTAVIDDAAAHATTFSVAAGTVLSPFNEKTLGNLRDVASPAGTAVEFTDSDDFTFGTGSGNPDTSFSVSMWLNGSDLSTWSAVFEKYDEYQIVIDVYDIIVSVGKISTTPDPVAVFVKASTPAGDDVLDGLQNSWINIVVTYTAQPGGPTTAARDNIQIYVNGSEITSLNTTATGTYTGMVGTANDLQVTPTAGNVWETAIWSGRVLTATDVQALYDAKDGLADSSKKSREYRTFTGTTSLANRPYMHMIDNATGSYPTIARIGSERSGKYNVPFDDTNTITFQEYGAVDVLNDALVIQGAQTASGTRFSGSMVASPNTIPDLLVASSKTQVPAGIADSRVTMTPGQDIGPFVEHQLYTSDKVGSGDPFWGTGSLPADVGPGFELPIWDKTKIEIDLSASESTTFGNVYTDANSLNPMVYFNNSLKRWEKIGRTYDSANVAAVFANLTCGFSPSVGNVPVYPLFRSSMNLLGSPMSNFGFPSDARYYATSSQLFDMGEKISAPFVAEKIVLEFAGSVNVSSGSTAFQPETSVQNFFILNQRSPSKIEKVFVTKNIDGNFFAGGSVAINIPIVQQTQTGGPYHFIDSIRDLVTFSSISAISQNLYDQSTVSEKALIKRDLTNIYVGSENANLSAGRHVVSSSIRTPVLTKRGQTFATRTLAGTGRSSFEFGSRNGIGESTGRSLANDITAQQEVKTTYDLLTYDTISITNKLEDNSPYILLPSDKLIFGWQAPVGSYLGGTSTSQSTMDPGPAKLTIYGSLLREGKEFHHGLNQLLTSDSVHEDIQDSVSLSGNAYCLDQINTAYYSQFSGSYLDRAFGAFDPRSESSALSRIDTSPNSIVDGMAGSTGSIYRGVRLSDGNERYYDSLMPEASHIARVNGNSFRVNRGTLGWADNDSFGFYILGDDLESQGTNPDSIWPRSFPFDARYGGSNEDTNPRTAAPLSVTPKASIENNDITTSKKEIRSFSLIWNQLYNTFNVPHVLATTASGDLVPAKDNQVKFLKGFYGFGDNGVYNLPEMFNFGSNPGGVFAPWPSADIRIRGFKYGLINALPSYTTCIFRHDRYGQFRDMLEQRPSAATDAGQKSAPVSVSFIKIVSRGASSEKEVLTTSDKDEIAQAIGGNVREIWNSRSNIDNYSRTTRPFFDSDRDIPTASTKSGIDVYQSDILNLLNAEQTQIILPL